MYGLIACQQVYYHIEGRVQKESKCLGIKKKKVPLCNHPSICKTTVSKPRQGYGKMFITDALNAKFENNSQPMSVDTLLPIHDYTVTI